MESLGYPGQLQSSLSSLFLGLPRDVTEHSPIPLTPCLDGVGHHLLFIVQYGRRERGYRPEIGSVVQLTGFRRLRNLIG